MPTLALRHLHVWFSSDGAAYGISDHADGATVAARRALLAIAACGESPMDIDEQMAGGFVIHMEVPEGVPGDVLATALMLDEESAREAATLLGQALVTDWGRFLRAWRNDLGTQALTVRQIVEMEAHHIPELSTEIERQHGKLTQHQLGVLLREGSGKHAGGLRLRPAGHVHHARRWQVDVA